MKTKEKMILIASCLLVSILSSFAEAGNDIKIYPPILIPARVKPAMEAAFKEGRNYFIWLVKDTDTYTATRAGMPFPHALIECYCVSNPKLANPRFKSTIEIIATTKEDSAETKRKYADARPVKDPDWWKAAQGGTPFLVVFAYVPQGQRLVGSGQAALYLIKDDEESSHLPISNQLTVKLKIPE